MISIPVTPLKQCHFFHLWAQKVLYFWWNMPKLKNWCILAREFDRLFLLACICINRNICHANMVQSALELFWKIFIQKTKNILGVLILFTIYSTLRTTYENFHIKHMVPQIIVGSVLKSSIICKGNEEKQKKFCLMQNIFLNISCFNAKIN